jgi:hypothetical protein
MYVCWALSLSVFFVRVLSSVIVSDIWGGILVRDLSLVIFGSLFCDCHLCGMCHLL